MFCFSNKNIRPLYICLLVSDLHCPASCYILPWGCSWHIKCHLEQYACVWDHFSDFYDPGGVCWCQVREQICFTLLGLCDHLHPFHLCWRHQVYFWPSCVSVSNLVMYPGITLASLPSGKPLMQSLGSPKTAGWEQKEASSWAGTDAPVPTGYAC